MGVQAGAVVAISRAPSKASAFAASGCATIAVPLQGAVQNLGRDWIIGKIAIGVIYDSDLTLAKTLIRQIGLDLTAPLILEPPKMQGVHPLGDFVVRIRAKTEDEDDDSSGRAVRRRGARLMR